MRRWLPLLIFTILVIGLLAYSPSGASDDNRVAVVVDFGNGQIAGRCVSFTEESISGFEALERTGLPVETDFQTGGAAVCRIDQQGCPANDCFCSCPGGGDCLYWSYWHLIDGAWNYSAAGSGLYQVRDGAVEGWVWGLGSVTQASPPPVVSFADVCAAEPTPTPTQTVTPSRTATPIVLPTAISAGTAPPTTVMSPAVSPSPQPTTAATGSTIATVTSVGSSMQTASPTTVVGPGNGGIGLPTPLFTPRSTEIVAAGTPSLNVVEDAAGAVTQPDPTGPALPAVTGTPGVTTALELAQPATTTVTEVPAFTIAPIAGADEVTVVNVEPATPLPDEVSAVIGADTQSAPAAAPTTLKPIGPVDWGGYAGFVGLLFLLSALALLVYRRRREYHRTVER